MIVLKLITSILTFLVVLCSSTHVLAQCAVDVTIDQGTSIEMCEEAPVALSASNGFVSYGWTGPETLSGQTITPQFSGVYVVTAVDAFGCASSDTIQVTINPSPTPTIISSEGNPICTSSTGTTLSIGTAYTSYDWGAGNTSPTFFASGPGAYAVTVVDANGCTGHDVISITEAQFAIAQTPTNNCAGDAVLLQASGGNSYLWSTGETGNSIVVAPPNATNYSVVVTAGSCVDTLTINVQGVVQTQFDLGDTLYLEAGDEQSLAGPFGFDTYAWSPGSMVNDSTAPIVTFTADSSFILHLTATHSMGCVVKDTLVIIVVDVTIPSGFSPNGDQINDFFVIPELYAVQGSLTVWNRWGDVVFESNNYENNWDGTCQTMFCEGNGDLPEGTYYYLVVVRDVPTKGYLTLKRR